MNVSMQEKNEITIVTINNERLDASSRKNFKDQLTQIIDKGSHRVRIDLSAVNFIDSSGLSILISIYKRLGMIDDGKFELCGLGKQPMELLEVTQLDKIFVINNNCD